MRYWSVVTQHRFGDIEGPNPTEPYVIRTFPADAHRDNLPSGLNDGALESMPGVLAANSEMLQDHVVNGEVVVPAGNYFVLGDNRDNSLDSRHRGFVKESQVAGKPFLIYDSEAGTGADVVPYASTAQRPHTRWNRIFKLL